MALQQSLPIVLRGSTISAIFKQPEKCSTYTDIDIFSVQSSVQRQKVELEKSIEKHDMEVSAQRQQLVRMQEDINREKVKIKQN